jgi:hypothetical protein
MGNEVLKNGNGIEVMRVDYTSKAKHNRFCHTLCTHGGLKGLLKPFKVTSHDERAF